MATQAFGKRTGASGRVERASRELSKGRTAEFAVTAGPDVAQREGEVSGGFSFKYFAAMLFMLMLFAAFVYVSGSGLYRDFVHGSHFVADGTIRVERAECKRTNFILTDCTIDLSWMTAAGPKKQSAGFMVLFTSLADTALVPLRSKRDPEVVSTQAGLDRMTNRTVTFLAFGLILLALVSVAFKMAFSGAAPSKQE